MTAAGQHTIFSYGSALGFFPSDVFWQHKALYSSTTARRLSHISWPLPLMSRGEECVEVAPVGFAPLGKLVEEAPCGQGAGGQEDFWCVQWKDKEGSLS